ncbi:MAG: hypothetical protein JJU29_12485 [Verrucomicrobia bacterium]|nr:hypothetical protein [Verrucomicrobiota bacterium]MCH8512914.1 hypothetical protein [Kiritimatiellia bacterium]
MILDRTLHLIFAALSALAIAYLATPLAMKIGVWTGMVDMPGGRRQHEKPTPRSGGLAIYLAFVVSIWLLTLTNFLHTPSSHFLTWAQAVITTCTLVVCFGVLDDRFEIRPLFKLGGQIIAAVVAWRLGIHLDRFLGVEIPDALDLAATVFLYVAAMNAYNLIDGMDGLAGGLGAITGLGLTGLNLIIGNLEMAMCSLILTGACLGFLRYNFHPAQVFLGDTGSMLIGFLLISITLGASARSAATIMLIVPILTMGVPLMDTGLAIWRRSVRKAVNKDSKVTRGDRDHIHHRLARQGLTQKRVAATLYVIQATVFAAGLLWVFGQDYRLAIFTIGFFAGSFVLLRYLATVEMTDSGRMIVDGIRRPGKRKLIGSLLPFFDIACVLTALFILHALGRPGLLNLSLTRLLRESAPPIVAGPLVLIWASRYYRPRWSRARALDYFYLLLLAGGGMLLGISLSTIPQHHTMNASILISLVLLALAVPPMVGLRVFPRLVQDLMHYHERQEKKYTAQSIPRTLIYGAGYGYTLLTRAESFDDTPRRRKYQLIGLMDDDPHLFNSFIHGHPVLGGLKDLPHLVMEKQITEVIITTQLDPKNLERLLDLADDLGLTIRQSIITHQVLYASEKKPNETQKKSKVF